MFGSIGGFELLVLAMIGLLVFGPRRLPEMGRTLAKGLAGLRKAAGDLTADIQKEVDLGELRKAAGDLHATIQQKAAGVFRELDAESRAVKEAVEQTEERPRAPGGTNGS